MIKSSPKVINNKWLYLAMLLVCFSISVGMRGQQFESWKETPSNFFVQDRPIMTTLDAPYWLRWAREYNEGVLWQKDHLREYPQATKTYRDMLVPSKFRDPPASSSVSSASSFSSSETSATKYSDVPLLSFVIAILASYFNFNYYLTGTLLVPILASLFILPLGVYFFRVGIPLSGLLGGLVGTFSKGTPYGPTVPPFSNLLVTPPSPNATPPPASFICDSVFLNIEVERHRTDRRLWADICDEEDEDNEVEHHER